MCVFFKLQGFLKTCFGVLGLRGFTVISLRLPLPTSTQVFYLCHCSTDRSIWYGSNLVQIADLQAGNGIGFCNKKYTLQVAQQACNSGDHAGHATSPKQEMDTPGPGSRSHKAFIDKFTFSIIDYCFVLIDQDIRMFTKMAKPLLSNSSKL